MIVYASTCSVIRFVHMINLFIDMQHYSITLYCICLPKLKFKTSAIPFFSSLETNNFIYSIFFLILLNFLVADYMLVTCEYCSKVAAARTFLPSRRFCSRSCSSKFSVSGRQPDIAVVDETMKIQPPQRSQAPLKMKVHVLHTGWKDIIHLSCWAMTRFSYNKKKND